MKKKALFQNRKKSQSHNDFENEKCDKSDDIETQNVDVRISGLPTPVQESKRAEANTTVDTQAIEKEDGGDPKNKLLVAISILVKL